LLGLAFGIILSRTFVRPDGPIEELDKAIAKREFVPHLQPVFDLKSNTIVGCEILARWPQPDGTILPPSRFIPLAEASGRIEALTWLLLSQGLAALRPLLRSDKSFCVSVNVAPSHFMSPHFVEDLQAVVRNHSVARRQVVVEITEREPFADLNSAKAAAARLRGAGFRLAIDDVGVGHSGLSHLQSLGANILKIDKFFVDSIDLDPTARSIVEVLVRLARQLGMSVVAEGIESRAQVEALLACGVAQGQGFHLLAPLSVEAFIELTKGHGAPAPARSSAA
jgi:sensor c-di-GMP phosphodiesterase-like protein